MWSTRLELTRSSIEWATFDLLPEGALEMNRRELLGSGLTLALAPPIGSPRAADADLAALEVSWRSPPRSCRPHTRWWWPGNALSAAEISAQLVGMRAQGLGGVELMTTWRFYRRGNVPFASPRWFSLVRHAVREARRLDLAVSLTFGAGWTFGGPGVPASDRSQVLAPSWLDIEGPATVAQALPSYVAPAKRLIHHVVDPRFRAEAPDEDRLLAAVAVPWAGERLRGEAALDLTSRCRGRHLTWQVPAGRWRVAAFSLRYTGQQNSAQDEKPPHWVVDHLNVDAVRRYCERLGMLLHRHLGGELGRTVDSLFCDSFEVVPLPDTLLWSRDLLARFREEAGYDLVPHLPALFWETGPLTPRVRYDVNAFLHRRGLAVLQTFRDLCARLGVDSRIQPHYRFTTEIVQAAAMAARPETEVTTPRFEVVVDPRKATVSGARLYGRPAVSAEAYTFLHRARYRSTLEELKVATDAFLRDGVTQIYNHGYLGSPEREVSPGRDVPWANALNHWNTLWPHYHHLAGYIARSCAMMRAGHAVSDVLVYSPQATFWCERVVRNIERRFLPYGDLGNVLVAGGYDFEVVNDDLLQNHATFDGPSMRVGAQRFSAIVLPGARALPVETARRLSAFVARGGLLVALGAVPERSVGLLNADAADREVATTMRELFGRAGNRGGRAILLPDYTLPLKNEPASRTRPPVRLETTGARAALLALLRTHGAPDFEVIGEATFLPGERITFAHRQLGELDIYFVTNLQPRAARAQVRFRTAKGRVLKFDPGTGAVTPVLERQVADGRTQVRLNLAAWQSCFYVCTPGSQAPAVRATDLDEVTGVLADGSVLGMAARSGPHEAAVLGAAVPLATGVAALVPPPFPLDGPLTLTAGGVTVSLPRPQSWTQHPPLRSFAGTGTYELSFELPVGLADPDLELTLDLGRVAEIAQVHLDGRLLGTTWMPPHRHLLPPSTRPGRHRLTIEVTNTLANRVAAMKETPPVPAALRARLGGTNAAYHEGERVLREVDRAVPELPSGLLGPVRIVCRRRLRLEPRSSGRG